MKRFVTLLALWLGLLPGALAAGWPAGCITPIALGQSANGQLTTADCWYYLQTPQNRYYTDVYSFSGTAGQQVSILLTSPTLDTYLDLYGVNDLAAAPLASDDDGAGNFNSRIPPGSGYFSLPTTGTYYIWVGTAIPNQTGAYTLTVSTASATPPPSGTPAAITVTEFHHPLWNHYFITAFPEEAASLRAGNMPPWVATGQTFKVWNAAGSGISNVCRFFNNEFSPKSSHFYSNAAAECPSLATRSRWVLESSDAFYMMASPTGTCPTGTVPLYRLYNDGKSGAPNHRYTIYPSVRTAMIAAGWIPEGNGPNGVFACVPPGGTEPPPPPSSAFQAEVTGYANTVLSLFNGNIANVDQLTVILGAGLAALENPSSTCPVATSTPPLEGLETFPPNLTLRMSFGSGCVVQDGATQATVSGSAVLTVSNLVFTETNVSGSLVGELRQPEGQRCPGRQRLGAGDAQPHDQRRRRDLRRHRGGDAHQPDAAQRARIHRQRERQPELGGNHGGDDQPHVGQGRGDQAQCHGRRAAQRQRARQYLGHEHRRRLHGAGQQPRDRRRRLRTRSDRRIALLHQGRPDGDADVQQLLHLHLHRAVTPSAA